MKTSNEKRPLYISRSWNGYSSGTRVFPVRDLPNSKALGVTDSAGNYNEIPYDHLEVRRPRTR